ncbi:MAG: response regulator transcription factor [Phycisphaerae bacterium]|nr:response regulator transcription factor [Phycisphaerae bacterium]
MSENEVRILLADDHPVVREGLRTMIENRDGYKVVGEAADGQAAVEMAAELLPDVVVMDVGMPLLNGVDATRLIVRQNPEIKVIALSMHSDKRFVLNILKAGAVGYVVKMAAGAELMQAIDGACADRSYLSSEVAGVVVDGLIDGTPPHPARKESVLSAREREVVQLLGDGKTSKEIALDLDLSELTVATHRRNIMRKLGIHSIAELTKYAIREGLTELNPEMVD